MQNRQPSDACPDKGLGKAVVSPGTTVSAYPGGVITYAGTLTPAQIEALREAWADSFRGFTV